MQLKIQANDTNKLIEKIRAYYLKKGKDIKAQEILIKIRSKNKTTLYEIAQICEEISKNYNENATMNLSTFFENEMDLKEVTITTK